MTLEKRARIRRESVALAVLQVGRGAGLLGSAVASTFEFRWHGKVRAQMRNVLQEEWLVPHGDVQEQDQVLMDLSHVSDVRHNGQAEFFRQQADRDELAHSSQARTVSLHIVHGVRLEEVLEDHTVGNVFTTGDLYRR